MSKNYSDSVLLSFIKDITTEKELFIKLGYTGHPNKIVCDKWFSKYESLGINIKSILRNNKKKLNQKSYICKQCDKVFIEKYSKYSSGDFCCKKCANTFSSTVKRKEINKKLKEHAKTNNKKIIDLYYKNPKYCICCQNIISFENKRNKTCCKECATMLRIKNHPHENDGGYREGSSRGKHGYYKGIWCDSTYELAYLIYCLDHDIDIKRCNELFEYELNGKKHTYHPDFVVEGIIIEIKNYYRQENDIKLNSINKEKRIYYYEDLIYCFD